MGAYSTFEYEKRLIEVADSFLGEGRAREARELLEFLTGLYPGNPFALVRLGRACELLADRTGAVDAYTKAMRRDGNCIEAYQALAAVLGGAEGISLLNAARERVAREPTLLEQLARLLIENGRLLECQSLIEEWVQFAPEEPKLYVSLAFLLEADAQFDEAEKALRRALELAPTSEQVNRELLSYYERRGNFEAALQLVQMNFQSVGIQSPLTVAAADLFIRLNHPQEAARVLNASVLATGDSAARKALEQIRSSRPARDLKQIVFVTESPRGRTCKISAALRVHGYRTVLICRHNHNACSADRHFDQVLQFQNPEHALLLARDFNPLVYHVASAVADDVSVRMIEEKPGPVIFDPYDIFDGMVRIEEVPPVVSRQQRFAIEHADGLLCRDLRMRHLFREFGYRRCERLIYFADYCDGIVPIRPKSTEEIRLVVAGYIGTNRTGNDDWGYLELAELLAAERVHLHLYPHPMQGSEEFVDFRRHAQENEYLHLHQSVKMEDVVQELSQYHMGLCLYWPSLKQVLIKDYSEPAHALCGSARLVDYLDAGLPAIIGRNLRFQYWSMHRYRLAVLADLKLFSHAASGLRPFLDDPNLSIRLERARSAHLLSRHISRLIRFYEAFR